MIDPFGGVALGSLDAMANGMTWIGVELEQAFVDLGQKNIDRWNEMYRSWPDWGAATIVQGDSRYLSSVIGEADGSISSPPFLHTTGGCGASTRPTTLSQAKAGPLYRWK